MKRTLILLYLYEALRATLFVLPIVVIYYENHKGVGIDGFYLTESAFALAIVLSIVPAGWLSDVWERKYVLALGGFFAAIGFTIEMFGFGFWNMAAGEFMVGVGFALASSSISAMAYDTLLSHDKQSEHLKVQSHLQVAHTVSAGAGSALGGWMYTLHPDLPMAGMVVTCVLAAFVALLMVEPSRQKERGEVHPVKDMLQTIRYALHGHKEVACIILLAVVVFTATKLAFWAHQPFFKEVGVPVLYFGFLVSAGLAASSLSALLAYKIEPKLKPKVTVLFLMLFPVLVYGVAGVVANQSALPLIVLAGTVFGFGKPVIDHAINKRVPSRRRATINSTKSFVMNIAFIVTAPFMGMLVEAKGPFVSMELLAVVLFAFALPTYFCLKKHKVV